MSRKYEIGAKGVSKPSKADEIAKIDRAGLLLGRNICIMTALVLPTPSRSVNCCRRPIRFQSLLVTEQFNKLPLEGPLGHKSYWFQLQADFCGI
jgi:hypothetical protein